MKIYLRGVFLVILFALFYFPSLFAQTPALGLPGENVPGELIVMFHSEVEQGFIDDFERNHLVVSGYYCNLKMEKVLSPLSHIYLFTYHENYPNIDLIVNVISDDVKVEAVQFNHYVEDRETIPNDPSLSSQWHHIQSGDHDIDSDLAWDITTGGVTDNGDRIVVCVLEGGGTNYSHVDLISNHWTNGLEIDNNGIDDDENGYVDDVNGWNTTMGNDGIATGNHGTAVSGMIGATGDNSIGGVGVNWDVEIMQVQMGGLSESNVIEAYSYPHKMRDMYNSSAGTRGAFVVATNASWGIDLANPAQYPVWCAYYDDLGAVGILNCGATANQTYNIDTQGDMPTGCSSDYMVSVTATNNNDVRTFSGYGATTIDLGAPGENVYLPSGSGSSYSSTSGTSFASPCVAGAIALLYSAPCSSISSNALIDPQGTADLVRGFLFDGVDQVSNLLNETVTGGRLNVANSVDLLMLACDPTLGCTDSLACNFSDLAITDIGNCLFIDDCLVCGGDNSSCSGCMDDTANNYDFEATLEDGTCCYISLSYIIDDSNVLCHDDNALITVIADAAVGASDSVWFALGNSPLFQNYSGEFSQSVGTYTVVATDLAGCMSTINIVVEGPDEVEITLSATGDLGDSSGIGTATATGGTGGYTFEWVDSSTGEIADPEGLEDGVYHVTVTDSNGCTDAGNVYVDDTYGLNDLDPVPFTLGPNPTSRFVNLYSNSVLNVESVEVHDSMGRFVFFSGVDVGNYGIVLDLGDLQNGIYSILIRGEAGFSVRQVAVQR
ncbi:MAG: S8 family serine peptidase [Flavobacteriales bacterium]